MLPISVVVFSICHAVIGQLPARYRPWHATFSNFLPVEEAVSLQNNGVPITTDNQEADDHEPSQWKKGVLAIAALSETIYWILATCQVAINLLTEHKYGNYSASPYRILPPLLLVVSWLYGALRPVLVRQRTLTVLYDLFVLYLMMLAALLLDMGSVLYRQYVHGSDPTLPLVTDKKGAIFLFHTLVLCVLLGTVVSLPVGLPPPGVDKSKIGISIDPEDYTPFWGWLTFWWVHPLVKRVSTPLFASSISRPQNHHRALDER